MASKKSSFYLEAPPPKPVPSNVGPKGQPVPLRPPPKPAPQPKRRSGK